MKSELKNGMLLKVFKDENHAINFINKGELHFADFEIFRGDKNDFRGDKNEGIRCKRTIYIEQNKGVFQYYPKTFYEEKFKAICCFYHFDTYDANRIKNKISEENGIVVYEVDLFDERMFEAGEFTVLITDTKKFRELLEEKLQRNVVYRHIKYEKEFKFFKNYNIFQKIGKKHDYQNEFRIGLLNDEILDNHGNIELGDLSDIAKNLKTRELRNIETFYEL